MTQLSVKDCDGTILKIGDMVKFVDPKNCYQYKSVVNQHFLIREINSQRNFNGSFLVYFDTIFNPNIEACFSWRLQKISKELITIDDQEFEELFI